MSADANITVHSPPGQYALAVIRGHLASIAAVSTARQRASPIVTFPPRELADFIIHYQNTDFHVHKFVLHHHSAYFRTYFDLLSPTSQNSSSTSSDAAQFCNHSSIPHCIHLPLQRRLVEKQTVTVADLRLFLCHLYFSSHYCHPPFLPKTDVDLATPSPPLSLHFAAVLSLDWSDRGSPLRSTHDGEHFARNEALLTLAYYLDCAAMMRQCQAVLLTKVQYAKQSEEGGWLAGQCLEWLPYADRYSLRQWRAECIRIIAMLADHPALPKLAEYRRAKRTWHPALWLEVQAAAAQRSARRARADASRHRELLITLPTLPIDTTAVDGVVLFPPRQHADFVVHYASTDFHVHKFVLHHHSAYFRAYFQTLSQSSSSSSSDASQPCNHPSIADCIHLPQQTTLVEKELVTTTEFRLFLCHLYFGAHYCYPPFLPTTDVDFEADLVPVSLHFLPVVPKYSYTEQRCRLRSTLDSCDEALVAGFSSEWPLRRCTDEQHSTGPFAPLVFSEALLALAHHFDCAAMMRQCEAVLLTKVEDGEKENRERVAAECSTALMYSVRYELHTWKAECIAMIAAADESILEEKGYQLAKRTWDAALD